MVHIDIIWHTCIQHSADVPIHSTGASKKFWIVGAQANTLQLKNCSIWTTVVWFQDSLKSVSACCLGTNNIQSVVPMPLVVLHFYAYAVKHTTFPIAHQVPHMPDKLQYTNSRNAMGRYGQKRIVSIYILHIWTMRRWVVSMQLNGSKY